MSISQNFLTPLNNANLRNLQNVPFSDETHFLQIIYKYCNFMRCLKNRKGKLKMKQVYVGSEKNTVMGVNNSGYGFVIQ